MLGCALDADRVPSKHGVDAWEAHWVPQPPPELEQGLAVAVQRSAGHWFPSTLSAFCGVSTQLAQAVSHD